MALICSVYTSSIYVTYRSVLSIEFLSCAGEMSLKKDSKGQDLSAKTPAQTSTTVKQKAPPKSVIRQLDDSFAELRSGAKSQTPDHDSDNPSASHLMAEMRKLSEEVRMREEHHRLREMQRIWTCGNFCRIVRGKTR